MNKQTAKHKWTFTSRFRAGAYGWKASRLAIQRIKEAVSEIKQVNRHDRLLAVEACWPHPCDFSHELGQRIAVCF
jgi:hypothetical protein